MKSVFVLATLVGLLLAGFVLRPDGVAVATASPTADVRVGRVSEKGRPSQFANITTSVTVKPTPKAAQLDWESLDVMRESGRSAEVLQLLTSRLSTAGLSLAETAMITAEIGSIYLLDLHQTKEAVAWYERSALSAPDDRNVLHQLASLYEATGQEGKGIEFLVKINADNASAGATSELGRLQLRQGSYAAAVQSLQQATYKHNDADTHYLLGLALRGNGNQLMACESFAQAMETLKDGDNAEFSSLSEKVIAQDLASCD